jgi:hypothetical protein
VLQSLAVAGQTSAVNGDEGLVAGSQRRFGPLGPRLGFELFFFFSCIPICGHGDNPRSHKKIKLEALSPSATIVREVRDGRGPKKDSCSFLTIAVRIDDGNCQFAHDVPGIGSRRRIQETFHGLPE